MNERRRSTGAEDMLASIRRLVADEVRVDSEPAPAKARLLLTPALRVDPARMPLKRSEKVRPLRTVLSERRAALASRGGLAPLLLSEDFAVAPASPALEPLRLVTPVAAPEPPRPAAETAAGTPPEVAPEHPPEHAPEAGADFLARLAELESLLDAQQEPYDFEESHLEAEMSPWLLSHAGALGEVPFIDLGLDAAVEPAPPAAAFTPEAPPEIAALAAEPASPAADEAVLRALIREVLREELEGPMGERVTRNLRKLIRSELSRAFAARGLT